MKKSLISLSVGLIGLLGSQTTIAACLQATEEQYQNTSVLLLGNKKELETYLPKYCIDLKKLTNNLSNTRDLETFKILETYNPDIFGITNNLGQDLLSNFLIKYTTKEVEPTEKEKRDIYNIYKTRFPEDKRTFEEIVSYPDSLKEKNRDEILSYISTKIKPKTFLQKDSIGNNTLSYIILSNKVNLINNVEKTIPNLKALLIQRNKDNYNNLHLMFSPILKDKNTTQLNDKIISLMNNQTIIMSSFPSIGYAEYAELMKENNPDFYKKIKEKFKLNPQTNIIKNVEESKRRINDNLDFFKKFK